jgi:hypothetical protein
MTRSLSAIKNKVQELILCIIERNLLFKFITLLFLENLLSSSSIIYEKKLFANDIFLIIEIAKTYLVVMNKNIN